MAAPNISCLHCNKVFQYRSGLSRHMKKEHPDEKQSNNTIECHLCESKLVFKLLNSYNFVLTRFPTIQCVISHLQKDHLMEINNQTLSFETQRHIDRAWRKALNDHIANKQDRIEVYHHLRVLLQEIDTSQFMVKIQQILSYLQDRYEQFYEYFKKNYIPNVHQWATCHRKGTTVNTNMFVESFHRVLKVIYLNNKQNRRVDHLLHVLLRIARNLIFKQLQQIEKGKMTQKV